MIGQCCGGLNLAVPTAPTPCLVLGLERTLQKRKSEKGAEAEEKNIYSPN